MDKSCGCGDDAEVGATVEFGCQVCQKVSKKITIKNPLKVAVIATVVAYGGSQFVDYAITDNRYPVAVEYTVLDACTSAYKEPLPYDTYGSKKRICLCALEDTMNEISYVRYLVDEGGFLNAFERHAKSCK